MIETKTFALVFLTAIAAMGATVTAGIFLQHANAAVQQNQKVDTTTGAIANHPCTSVFGACPGGTNGPNSAHPDLGGSSLNSLPVGTGCSSITNTCGTNPSSTSTAHVNMGGGVVCNTNPGNPAGACK